MADEAPQNDQDNIAALRAKADEAAEARKELERLQRELTFTKAGVDIETGVGALLYKAYDGEMTVEAIKAQASELGITAPAATPDASATPPAPPVDVAQTQARLDLASGGAPAAPPDADPYKSAMQAFEEAVASGLDPEYASAAAFQKVFAAAAAGDRRVRIR